MQDCVFCRIISREEPAHIVYEDDRLICFLDKYPQTRGHMQLVPKIHVRWIYDTVDMATFFRIAQKIIHGIIPVLGCDHVSFGTFGREVDHAHLWIVPQYKSEVRVTEGVGKEKQDLESLATLVRNAINSKFQAPNSK